jgi:hypothetical protein
MPKENRQKSDVGTLFKDISLMLTGSSVLLGTVILVGVWQSGDRFFGNLKSLFNPPPPPAPKVETRSVVIQQIRQASELTTAVFTMEAVVPTQQDAALGGVVIGTTRLLYIARGEVRAGVDLSRLTPENIQVIGDLVRLRLPPPKLLDKKIDVARSSVYDYNRGPLGLGPDVAPNLQKLAQEEALKKIQAAACSDGILEKANDRAKLAVSQLIRSSGVKEILVETQPPSPTECQSL